MSQSENNQDGMVTLEMAVKIEMLEGQINYLINELNFTNKKLNELTEYFCNTDKNFRVSRRS